MSGVQVSSPKSLRSHGPQGEGSCPERSPQLGRPLPEEPMVASVRTYIYTHLQTGCIEMI